MREWVKVQLKDTDEARHASSIVRWWKTRRQAAQHIVKAISLYYALMSGDTTMLFEMFPLLRSAIVIGSSTDGRREFAGELEVTLQAKSEQDDIDDFLSEFGL